jgi:hypothetical protein
MGIKDKKHGQLRHNIISNGRDCHFKKATYLAFK